MALQEGALLVQPAVDLAVEVVVIVRPEDLVLPVKVTRAAMVLARLVILVAEAVVLERLDRHL